MPPRPLVFAALLDAALRQRGMSAAALAARLTSRTGGSADRASVSAQFISKILVGARRPPPSQLEAIATALDLVGRQRSALIDAGMLAGLEPEVVAWIERRSRRQITVPAPGDVFPAGESPVRRRGRQRRRPAVN